MREHRQRADTWAITTYDELIVPALATAASTDPSSMEGFEPMELRNEVTRLWQGALLPASPKASCTQSADTSNAVTLCCSTLADTWPQDMQAGVALNGLQPECMVLGLCMHADLYQALRILHGPDPPKHHVMVPAGIHGSWADQNTHRCTLHKTFACVVLVFSTAGLCTGVTGDIIRIYMPEKDGGMASWLTWRRTVTAGRCGCD